MYTKEQIEKPIETYKVIGTVTATITKLGYPSRQALYEWLHNYGLNSSYGVLGIIVVVLLILWLLKII